MLMLLSPLITGLIRKIKNNLRMRKGAPLLQPYKDMRRLFQKEDIIPETSSWVFKIAPAVCLASTVIAFFLIPSPAGRTVFSSIPGLITLVFVLAAGRFFVALAALDTGSSFGGMGASREMFISSLVEPAFCLAVFSIFLQFG